MTMWAMLASTMVAIDITIANVALPHMQSSLSASQDQVVWVLTSYLVAGAIAALDTVGVRRVSGGACLGVLQGARVLTVSRPGQPWLAPLPERQAMFGRPISFGTGRVTQRARTRLTGGGRP